MPSWTPGSYLIRDFSGHLHVFEAVGKNRKKLDWVQTGKDSWKVFSKDEFFKIHYRIFAHEHSVRTNFLDTEYGFINPPAFFIYPKGMLLESVEIGFDSEKYFSSIYSTLSKKKKNQFYADSFHLLFDSPIQISNKESYSFQSDGCNHEVIFEGETSHHFRKILKDLKKITDTEIQMMGGSPNKRYLFIINLTDSSYGGLEHSSSSVNIFDPAKLSNKEEYLKLLGLLAHEYFHLWNVKRIRPIEFDPFDYQNPVLTKELWIAEGATSFYDNFVLLKCGFLNPDAYLSEILQDIQTLENSDGENWMSLEESSLTAWTKYYRPQPNSHNTGISYYIKGSLVVLGMDFYIRDKTKSKKSFLDVLRFLYEEYYKKQKRGFTKKEFFEGVKTSCGVDLEKEFDGFLTGRKRFPIYEYLSLAGIEKRQCEKTIDLGFSIKDDGSGKQVINKIFQHRISREADLSVGDELIAVNGKRVTKENFTHLKNSLDHKKEVRLLISRRGKVMERFCMPDFVYSDSKLVFQQSPTQKQMEVRENFFKTNEHVSSKQLDTKHKK